VCAGIYKQNEFDPREYFYYDDPMNGDMHEVLPGKFIAFRGPVGDDACDSTREGTLSQRCGSTLSALAFFDTFKDKNVSTIIRLNSIEYSAAVFERAGFAHFDLTFEDCGVPSDSIVDNFLRIAEQVPPANVYICNTTCVLSLVCIYTYIVILCLCPHTTTTTSTTTTHTLYIYINIYIYTHTYIQICKCICMYVFMYVCTCVCVCVCVCRRGAWWRCTVLLGSGEQAHSSLSTS
jgi:hypothetical protein